MTSAGRCDGDRVFMRSGIMRKDPVLERIREIIFSLPKSDEAQKLLRTLDAHQNGVNPGSVEDRDEVVGVWRQDSGLLALSVLYRAENRQVYAIGVATLDTALRGYGMISGGHDVLHLDDEKMLLLTWDLVPEVVSCAEVQ